MNSGNSPGFTPIIRFAIIDGGVGHYPDSPFSFFTYASFFFDGNCHNVAGTTWAAPVETFVPSDIGTPPFSLR